MPAGDRHRRPLSLLPVLLLAACVSTPLTPEQHYEKGSDFEHSSVRIIEYRNGQIERVYDQKAAFRHYLAAAEAGHFKAMAKVVEYYESGKGGVRDLSAALRWRLKLGGPAGEIGKMYEEGRGTEKDYREALKWYRKGGYPVDEARILARGGHGVQKDVDAAHEVLIAEQKRLEQDRTSWTYERNIADVNREILALDEARGGPYRKFEIGLSYMLGPKYRGRQPRQSKVDMQKASEWFEKAAKLGHVQAMHNLGVIGLSDGSGGVSAEKVDYELEKIEALFSQVGVEVDRSVLFGEKWKWFLRAAEEGQPRSSFLMGRVFAAARETVLAEKYLRIAAEQGQPDAQFRLAELLLGKRDATEEQRTEVLELLRSAAMAGYYPGQVALAVALAGRPDDKVEAYAWFAVAEDGRDNEELVAARKKVEAELGWELVRQGERRAEELRKTIVKKTLVAGEGWR